VKFGAVSPTCTGLLRGWSSALGPESTPRFAHESAMRRSKRLLANLIFIRRIIRRNVIEHLLKGLSERVLQKSVMRKDYCQKAHKPRFCLLDQEANARETRAVPVNASHPPATREVVLKLQPTRPNVRLSRACRDLLILPNLLGSGSAAL
jgi:hypothetical protein